MLARFLTRCFYYAYYCGFVCMYYLRSFCCHIEYYFGMLVQSLILPLRYDIC